MPDRHHRVTLALAVTVVCLLAVGVESGSVRRHLLQVAPMAVALTAVARRRAWGPDAAAPMLGVWLALMLCIWLFVLGVTQVFGRGHFTPFELVMTALIAGATLVGIPVAIRAPAPARSLGSRLGTAVVAGAVQVGCVWLSLRPFIARD